MSLGGGGILCSALPASPKVLPSFSFKNKKSSSCVCFLRALGEISIVDGCSPRFETQATKMYVLKMVGSFDHVPGRFPVGVV
ncbi:hypothetical protein F2Q70_00033577 [Brassica cretica]|uniref:Uncharacterized protein n=1 Tax=Brassica cretica TaxID=69181 RepID=A0A3N6Q648_BRACR|nr:hypothetical protein F2Q70_00033577 [Brassica cretica]KAF3598139.1 hypothetical protein DY000_02028095 [Brassica cretica]